MQTAAINGEVAFRNAGFLEYAASNDIIAVFPQNYYNLGSNLFCCWSHQDYTLPDENSKNNLGIQNEAFRQMITRITSERDASIYDYFGWKGFLSSEGVNLADQDPGIQDLSFWLTLDDIWRNWLYYVCNGISYGVMGIFSLIFGGEGSGGE